MNNKYDHLIEQAYKLQKLNKLQEAKNIYKKLLGVCFDNVNLYICYAELHVSLKDYKTAIEFYHKALKLSENNFDILFNLSLAYKYSNDIDSAITYALKAFDIKFDDCNNLINLAGLYSLKNEIEPEFYYLSKAAFQSNNPDLLYRCGLLANKANNTDLAIEFFQKVLEVDSDRADALTQIAIIYIGYDKSVAIEMFAELLKNNPTNELYLSHLAHLTYELERFAESLKYSKKLVELYPNDSSNYAQLCSAYSANNMIEKALETAKIGYDLDPTNINAVCSYIYKLSSARMEDEALEIISKYPEEELLQREYMEIVLRRRDFEKGKQLYFDLHSKFASVEKINENLKYHFKMNNGFQKYKMTEEMFLKNSKYSDTEIYKNRFNFKKKQLVHQSIDGKRVVIYSQHGAGDYIMSARYFNFVSEKAKEVILFADKSMKRLTEFSFPNIKFVSRSDSLPFESYDYATPDMCLIYNLGMDFYNIPYSDGYFKVDDVLIKEKSKIIEESATGKRKIGLYWQGNPKILKNRAIKLSNFMPIIENEKNKIFSFQMSDVDKESHELKSKLNIIDLAPYISDYMDTAAFLKNIDVLITIDTSIAHLAGAIGVKTFLILPYDSEWRWFNDTDTTPWYSSVKIFKQELDSSWSDVINRINEYLDKENERKI